MAGRHFSTLSLLLLLVAFSYTQATPDVPKTTEKKIEVVVVEATVYCQSCDHFGTWSMIGAKPISSAKVSVTCKSYNGHVSYYKPVWSPLESCSLLSNVNYGLNGAPLRYENKRLHGSKYEAVIYAAGPLAFRPSECSQTHY
ncbi:hypothetical protein ACSQ67_002244 [Phaseolus vulgaris]